MKQEEEKRALQAKDLTAYVCLYSNPSVMWFSGILMSPRIILLICQCFCLSPDFTSFIVFDLHNALYACVAINESHSLLHRLSAQFFPIYLQMVIWHTWIGNSNGMPKRRHIFFKHSNHLLKVPINTCCAAKAKAKLMFNEKVINAKISINLRHLMN